MTLQALLRQATTPWDEVHNVGAVGHADARYEVYSENPNANLQLGVSWLRIDGVITIRLSDLSDVPVGSYKSFYHEEAPRLRCVIKRAA